VARDVLATVVFGFGILVKSQKVLGCVIPDLIRNEVFSSISGYRIKSGMTGKTVFG
jgi:hypothetical protein